MNYIEHATLTDEEKMSALIAHDPKWKTGAFGLPVDCCAQAVLDAAMAKALWWVQEWLSMSGWSDGKLYAAHLAEILQEAGIPRAKEEK